MSGAAPEPTFTRQRVLAFVAVLVVSAGAAVGYAIHAAHRGAGDPALTGQAPLAPAPTAERPHLLFRSTALDADHGRIALARLDARGAAVLGEPPRITSLHCDRVHFAAGRGVCLEAKRSALTVYEAHVFDRDFKVLHTLPLAGPPSRARVSPDGRFAAVTVFVSGHGYAGAAFTTRTSVIDTATGQFTVPDFEAIEVSRDGRPFRPRDANFWGVTFARNGNGFFATLGTGDETLLVQGDVAERRARVVHAGVECPSLAPDGARVAFKRRVATSAAGGRLRWQIVVLELASGHETVLAAETRSVDDQVEWLNDREIVYAMPTDPAGGGLSTDVWAIAADGTGAPRLLLPRAFSPAVVR